MDLTPELAEHLKTLCTDPITWAKYFVKIPGMEGATFEPNFVQKKILNCKTRKCVILVSRRAGKSYSLIIKALFNMFTRNRCQVLLIAPGEAQLQRFFDEFDTIVGENPHLAKDIVISRSKPPYRKLRNGSFMHGFIAKDGSKSLRGQSADLVLVDEADFIPSSEWKVIDPIVRGDKTRKPPELFAASTPNLDPKSRFLQMVFQDMGDDEYSAEYINDVTPVFVPITENQDYTPEEVAAIKKEYEPDRLAQFEQEYLCLPVSVNEAQVFKTYQLNIAAELEPQVSDRAPTRVIIKDGYPKEIEHLPAKMPGEIRAVGVDWDRVQAGPTMVVVSYIPGLPKLRVLYRQEVDKNSKYVYEEMANRLMECHEVLHFDYIYLESTRDAAPSQNVQIKAKSQAPDLYDKDQIKLIDFNENHVSLDAYTKERITRRVKNVMVRNLQNIFENEQISFPKDDNVLRQQLSSYTILGYTSRGERYSDKNEHFVDALGLACWAIFKNFTNPFLINPATRVVGVRITPKGGPPPGSFDWEGSQQKSQRQSLNIFHKKSNYRKTNFGSAGRSRF